MSDRSSPRHAIIIGAGPAGLSAAGLLADAGWRCDVYEASSEEKASVTSSTYLERAYGLSCQVRALRVLQRLNALQDVMDAGGYWREATFRHDAEKGALPVFQVGKIEEEDDDLSKTLSCLRTELVAGLLSSLRRQWKSRVSIHWECPVQRIHINDANKICVTVSGSNTPLEADVIICADGSTSPVGRRYLAALEPSILMKNETSGFSTRTLLLSDKVDVSFGNNHKQKWIPRSNSLHFIIGQKGRLLLLGRHTGPRPSKALTTASGIQTMLVYPDSHEELNSPHLNSEILKSVLAGAFTSAQLPMHAATEEDLQRCANSHGAALPGVVQCSQYHCKNFVLIGDAAHCSPTNNAQGVNVAMEDASILVDLLEERNETGHSKSIEAQLEMFTKKRKPDMDALQRMLCHPFYESSRPTWRTRVVTNLHNLTGISALGPMTNQVYAARLPLVQCENHMLLQYHLPVLLAALSLSVIGCFVVLVMNLLIKVFTRAPRVS